MSSEHPRTKVLFVDDDPVTIERVRHGLDEHAARWDVRFAKSAREALAELEFHGPYDAVITDLRMPHVDGAALLAEVKAHHPATVRVVMSDFLDLSSALRSVPVAQQFLESPVEISKLIATIERCADLSRRLENPSLRAMLGQIDLLPTPPSSVVALNEVMNRQDGSIDEVAKIIEADPAMTAKLLQLVNSAFFGLSHRVTDARHAVTYLGLATVRNLLSAVELVRAFTPANPELVRAVEGIHVHSMAVAEMARTLMAHRHQVHDAFAAGMMHDVGLLALISCAPDRFLALRDEAMASGRPLVACESEVLGTTHATLGAYLLNAWGLPHALVEAVARSHDADRIADRTLTPAHAVFVAEQVLNVLGRGGSMEGGRLPDHEYLSELGVADVVTQMVGRVRA